MAWTSTSADSAHLGSGASDSGVSDMPEPRDTNAADPDLCDANGDTHGRTAADITPDAETRPDPKDVDEVDHVETGEGPRCQALGPAGVGYFDPEVLSTSPVTALQDVDLTALFARIEPATGLFEVGRAASPSSHRSAWPRGTPGEAGRG